jgi:hypothetical protein
MPLPQNGQLNWGTPLNADIANDEANIANLQQSVASHENNTPADPHGDRAFTSSLVTPIITGLNAAPTPTSLGLVQLTANGKIPLALVPTGAGLFTFIDAVPDFNVPTNGQPAASALNAALLSANAQGGGIVWVGSGNYGIDQPLVIYENTWLMCSPGAVFQRYVTTSAPVALLQNYSQFVAPNGGNIRITGGYWDVATVSATGVAFSFAHTAAVLIEDLIVVAYSDGHSPVAALYGCSNVTMDNVSVYGPPPVTVGRGNQFQPVVRVEEINATNLPNNYIPNSVLDGTECSNIVVRACTLSPIGPGSWPSDSYGTYSAWTSFVGTTGTVAVGGRHTNINIVDGCYAAALAVAGVQVNNWNNVTAVGCDFNYPKQPYVLVQDGVANVVPTAFQYNVNSPNSAVPIITQTVVNTVTETTLCQLSIPANDWRAGSTAYRTSHSGTLSIGSSVNSITLKMYVGTNSNFTSDTLAHTMTIGLSANSSAVPFAIHQRGFAIDSSGFWTPEGWEFTCAATTSGGTLNNGSVRLNPTAGQTVYVTITATWTTARVTDTIVGINGVIERVVL